MPGSESLFIVSWSWISIGQCEGGDSRHPQNLNPQRCQFYVHMSFPVGSLCLSSVTSCRVGLTELERKTLQCESTLSPLRVISELYHTPVFTSDLRVSSKHASAMTWPQKGVMEIFTRFSILLFYLLKLHPHELYSRLTFIMKHTPSWFPLKWIKCDVRNWRNLQTQPQK